MTSRARGTRGAAGVVACLAVLLLLGAAVVPADAQEFQVSPEALDFGVIKPGVPTQKVLSVRNPGADRIEVRLQLSGDAPFRVDADTLRLPAGGERRIAVTFSAADSGRFDGELGLQAKELFGSHRVVVPLSARVALPSLRVRPDIGQGLDAGATTLGTPVRSHVELTNTGSVDLVFDSIAVVPVDVGFQVGDEAPQRLAPGAQARVAVDFSPVADGAVAGRLALYSRELPAGVVDVPLRGQGMAPQLAVSPLPEVGVDYGTAEVGTEMRRPLSFLNPGRAALEVQVTVEGDAFGAVEDTSSAGIALTVPPGSRQDVEIAFRPRYEGPASGRVVLRTNDPARPDVELPLRGRALVTPPRIEVLNRSPIQFGAVPIGQQADEQLLLWNRGGSPFTTRFELEAGTDAEFQLQTGALVLQPGESGKVELTFTPKEIGSRESALWIETEAGRTRYLLSGTGKFLKLTPSAYDFGRVPVGESSSGVIELMNIGNADFTISRIHSTSDDFSLYAQVSPDSKFLLPANSLRSLPVNVTFEPAARGLSTGTLRLEGFWEEGTETLEVLLNGTGVAAEIELLPAGTLDFGHVVLGDTTMRTLVATNTGDTSLQVEANLLTREARIEPPVFALEPGQSTTLKVYFTPDALGDRFGQILLISNDVRDKAQPIKIKGHGALANIDLSQVVRLTSSTKDSPVRLPVRWNNTPLIVPDGAKIDVRFQVPDSLRQALVGRTIDIEWIQLDENYDPKGSPKQTKVVIYEDAEASVLAEDLNLRMNEGGNKRVRLKLTTHSYPGSPPQSVSQVLEEGGWKFELEAKPLVSFLTIRPGRDWTDSDGNRVEGETERLIGLPGIAFLGWHNAEHPLVSGVHLTAIGNVLEALQTNNHIAVSLGVAVSMYKDRFLFGFGWDIYDSRTKVKRKGSQDYIMTFKYSGLF